MTTAGDRWQVALTAPRLVLVDQDGRIDALPVDWTVEHFRDVGKAMDCAHAGGKRCGAAFADFKDLIAKWPQHAVPAASGNVHFGDELVGLVLQRWRHRFICRNALQHIVGVALDDHGEGTRTCRAAGGPYLGQHAACHVRPTRPTKP